MVHATAANAKPRTLRMAHRPSPRARVSNAIRSHVLRKLIPGGAVVLAIWGAILTFTGGVDTRVLGIAIRSRDPFRALVASLLLFLVASVVYRWSFVAMVDRLGAALRRFAVPI